VVRRGEAWSNGYGEWVAVFKERKTLNAWRYWMAAWTWGSYSTSSASSSVSRAMAYLRRLSLTMRFSRSSAARSA